MKVDIVTIAYNSGKSIARLFETAMLDADHHDITLRVFTHSGDKETVETCLACSEIFPTISYDYRANMGLARSWNEGIMDGYNSLADVVIVVNDDIFFSVGDVDKIARKAVTSRGHYMVSAAGWHEKCREHRPSQGYSCFAINPVALERIGAFDENFSPAYFEDTDHHRRADLQGLVEENCSDTNVVHGGSLSVDRDVKRVAWYQRMFQLNMEYFMRKWDIIDIKGGFPTPFNNPEFDLFIPFERRHNPYGPGYDREDIGRA